jgi:hypothetical protein
MEFLAKNIHPINIGMKGVASGLNLTHNDKHKMNGGSCKYDKCDGNI